MSHISVLMKEVIEGLDVQPNDIIVDATVNGGGHAYEITNRLGPNGVFIGIDQDASALEVSATKLKNAECDVHLINDNFKNISQVLTKAGVEDMDKILFDLGWSSNQFEDPQRGFSFMHDGPLTMTLSDDPTKALFTAHDIVNKWESESIIDILKAYGEERYAKQITRNIVEAREVAEIASTQDLVNIINRSVPSSYRHGRIHPATKTFQALRIAVNDEFQVLQVGLEASFQKLKSNGLMLVISFHSSEDRIVKRFFRSLKEEGKANTLTKKPIIATDIELEENRRARSAKLRIIQKI